MNKFYYLMLCLKGRDGWVDLIGIGLGDKCERTGYWLTDRKTNSM